MGVEFHVKWKLLKRCGYTYSHRPQHQFYNTYFISSAVLCISLWSRRHARVLLPCKFSAAIRVDLLRISVDVKDQQYKSSLSILSSIGAICKDRRHLYKKKSISCCYRAPTSISYQSYVQYWGRYRYYCVVNLMKVWWYSLYLIPINFKHFEFLLYFAVYRLYVSVMIIDS